jgi:O-antigen/teichoic acid export membrane protein
MTRPWIGLVLLIFASRALSMALSAVCGVLFARILGPEKIGLSAIVAGGVTLGNLIVNLVPVPMLVYEFKRLTDPGDQVRLLIESSALRLSIAVGFVLVAPVILLSMYADEPLGSVAFYLVPLVLLSAGNPIWLFQAMERQGIQAVIALCSPACSVVLALFWLQPTSGTGTDLAITLAASSVSTIVSWGWIYCNLSLAGATRSFRITPRILQLLRDGRWLIAASLAGYFYLSFEEQLVGYLDSPRELGIYRTAKISADAVGSFLMVTSVLLFPRYIEWRKQNLKEFARRIRLLSLAFATAAVVFWAAAFFIVPVLYPLIFGANYSSAATPCLVLLAAKGVVLVSNVFSWALLAEPRNYRSVALVMLFSCPFSLITNMIFIPSHGMVAAAASTLMCEILNLVLYVWLLRRELRDGRLERVGS